MFNIQEFKNATIVGSQLVMLVDDVNESLSYGFTDSVKKVTYNLSLIEHILRVGKTDEALAKSKNGLTTLLPLGRYITVLQMSKDKKTMRMIFLDYMIDYHGIDLAFNNLFSKELINSFKNIKYQMEEHQDQWIDNVLIDPIFEPA